MRGRLTPRGELTPSVRAAMFELLAAHFEGVSEAQFTADLEEKNWVVLLEDAGRLVGFSTLLLYDSAFEGEELTALYSGDTIVDPRAWGSSALPRCWIESVLRLHRGSGRGRLIWMLITSGFRTYRFLPLFWRAFYPRHDRATPPGEARLLRALARERFGSRFDPAAGVVRFERPQALRAHLRGIPEARRFDPHIAFFDRANPGAVRGDELVCITEIAEANLTSAGWRMVRAGRPGQTEAPTVAVIRGR